MAKGGIYLETVLNDPHAGTVYPPQPTYEKAVEVHTQATERDQKLKIQQLKVTWRINVKGVGDRDYWWRQTLEKLLPKIKNILNLFMGTEGHSIFNSKQPQSTIERNP